MSYFYEVVRDKPIALYLFDEEGTTATDYSGYDRDATLSFTLSDGRLPIVAETSLGMKMETGDTVEYPVMPIWGASQNSYKFSIEIWFYDYGAADATLFAPVDADGPLTDIGIFLSDGRLTFRVGNATGLEPPETYLEVTHQLADIRKAHMLVAEYTQTGVDLNIDGIKYFISSKNNTYQKSWTHDLTGFVTSVQSGSIMFDTLAVFQNNLEDLALRRHFDSGTAVTSPSTMAPRYGGSYIPFDGDGSVAYLNWNQPNPNKIWEVTEQKNTYQTPWNTIGLKRIPSPAVSEDVPDLVFDTSQLSLQPNQGLYIQDASEHINATEGCISGRFYVDSTKHLSVGEYCLFSAGADYESIGMWIINRDISIRHKYYNSSLGEYIVEDVMIDTATLNANVDIFFMWSRGVVTVYLNDWTSPIQYDTSSTRKFYFNKVSDISIGIDSELSAEYFESKVSLISLWKELPDVEDTFADQLTLVTNYTLPLVSSAAVSQKGWAKFAVNAKGIGEATESKIVYGPECSNIIVSQSVDGETYTTVESSSYTIDFAPLAIMSEISPYIYLKVELETEDSYLDVPELEFLEVVIVKSSVEKSRQSSISANPMHEFVTNRIDEKVISKHRDNGINLKTTGLIEISSTSATTVTSDDDDRAIPTQPPQAIKSVEFFVKQNEVSSSSLNFYSNSDGEIFSMENISDVINIAGFDSCYVNKNDIGSGDTGESFLLDEWTHVILTTAGGAQRENLIVNPKLGADDTGWNSYSEASGARVEMEGPYSSYVYEITAVGTSTTEYGANLGEGTDGYPATAGENYTGLVFLKSETTETSRLASVGLKFYDVAGVYISEIRSDEVPDYDWFTVFAVNGVAPVGTVYASVDVIYESGIPDGEKHYVSSVMLEESDNIYTYFDGDFDGAEWSGTPDGSTSIFKLGVLVDGTNSAFIGNGSTAEANNASFSYKNICLYRDLLDQDDVNRLYGSWLGKYTITITDGGLEYDNPYYLVPMVIGGLEIESPKIEDLEILAVAASWTIY